jgi:transposase InsO family protein
LVETTIRTPNNVYILNKIGKEVCCVGQTNERWLWHKIMGHLSFDNLVKVSNHQVVRGMPKIIKPSNLICKHCQHGKQTRMRFRTNEYSTSRSLELIHTDLCGPTKSQSLQGNHYFMSLIDDYTRMTWVAFLRDISESFKKFKAFKELVENEIYLKIKCTRSDNGGGFTSDDFNEFCEDHGIR